MCLCFSQKTRASHTFGADFYYTHVSGNTYTIVLDVYGDCSGASFPNLPNSTPGVEVYDNGVLFQTLDLTLSGPGVEVTPVCPAQINNTTCNGGSIPGVKKFSYTGTVTLSGPSANWLFRFNGSMGFNLLAGRSNSMTNILVPGGGSVMVLEATLNNTVAPNSSVNYTTIPTPFFCINIPTQYNPGAVDPNNDNLSFALVAGIQPAGNVTYISPYTASQPLGTAAGSFSFSNTTGQLNFTPNITQRSLVVYRVEEYRNGILVGTSMREMTFIVINTCNNNAPAPGPITGLNLGVQTSPTEIQVCEGTTGTLNFNFTASDANNDHITITYAGLPAGATATISNNNTTAPQFNFSWNVNALATGNYTFYVTFKDDGCPLASTQTVAYTIVVAPFNSILNTGALSGCINESNGVAWVHPQGTGTYSYTWTDAGGNIIHQSQNNTTGDTVYTLASGTYSVHIINQFNCDKTIQITVPQPNYHAGFSSDTAACLSQPTTFQNTSTSNISSWEWDFGDGTSAQAASPSHTYNQVGTYTVTMIGHTANGCSDTATAQINIRKVTLTVSSDTTICEGAWTVLTASGADTYSWTPFNSLSCATCPSTFAFPVDTTTFTVTGTSSIGCKGTAEITVNVLPTGLIVSPNDTGICPRDSLQLHVSGYDSVFRWIPVTGLSDTGANPWVSPTGPLTYTVVADYKNGCHDTEQVHIRFLPDAVIYLPDSARIYPGESYQIDPGGNCLYFHWFPSLGLDNDHIANPVAQPPVNTRYFVEGRTEGGCTNIDSIDIYVSLESLLDVPNAFTPGGGGNDVVKVINRGNATLKYFRIFNRWGNKVFETGNISEGWDGSWNGSPQPMGVYVYMVEAYTNTGRKFYKQGNITLIR